MRSIKGPRHKPQPDFVSDNDKGQLQDPEEEPVKHRIDRPMFRMAKGLRMSVAELRARLEAPDPIQERDDLIAHGNQAPSVIEGTIGDGSIPNKERK